MQPQSPADGNLLPPYSVLDLAGASGAFCAKLLADYGADVIKIEPPSGDYGRSKGPFLGDDPHPERSMYFLYYNTNKRSITLNLETELGRAIFRKLAATADVLVESFPVGYLKNLRLDYESLREANPGLVMASVTPFGQEGPWKDYKSSDLIVMAASGYMQITGDPDGPPVRQGNETVPFSRRPIRRRGNIRRTVLPGCVGWHGTIHRRFPARITDKLLRRRPSGGVVDAPGTERDPGWHQLNPGNSLGAYPCQDGWISAGVITRREWEGLSHWIYEVTGNQEVLNEKYQGGNQERAPHIDIISAMFMDFTMRFKADELFHEGQKRNLVFIPVNNVADLVGDPQLEASNLWTEIEHPVAGSLKYPLGVFNSEEVSPSAKAAPQLGHDNQAVYCQELGYSTEDLAFLRAAGLYKYEPSQECCRRGANGE